MSKIIILIFLVCALLASPTSGIAGRLGRSMDWATTHHFPEWEEVLMAATASSSERLDGRVRPIGQSVPTDPTTIDPCTKILNCV